MTGLQYKVAKILRLKILSLTRVQFKFKQKIATLGKKLKK